jgi:hypothetical protein
LSINPILNAKEGDSAAVDLPLDPNETARPEA